MLCKTSILGGLAMVLTCCVWVPRVYVHVIVSLDAEGLCSQNIVYLEAEGPCPSNALSGC